MKSVPFFTDADNTLWDTDLIYRKSHAQLIARVCDVVGIALPPRPLEFLRQFDIAIAEAHPAGLSYPVELLVAALCRGLSGVGALEAAKLAMAQPVAVTQNLAHALAEFRRGLLETPQLRLGVREGLVRLAEARVPFVVLTEGDLARVRSTLMASGLPAPSQCISLKKHVSLYRAIAQGCSRDCPPVMVGDQLDKDVGPAADGGLLAVYFPSTFVPCPPDPRLLAKARARVDSFADAVDFYFALRELPSSRGAGSYTA